MLKMLNLSLFLFTFAILRPSLCLYEDQVGKFDWKSSYIGQLKESQIDFKSKVKRVFVTSENNTVASLSLKSGAILWRQILGAGESNVIHKLYVTDDSVYTLSGSNPVVIRRWNSNNGVLLSEAALPHEFGSGAHYWSINGNTLTSVLVMEYALVMTPFYLKEGIKAAPSKTVSAPWLSSKSMCKVYDTGLMCISEKGVMSVFEFSALAPKNTQLEKGMPAAMKVVPSSSSLPAVQLTYSDGSSEIAAIAEYGLISRPVPKRSSSAVHSIGANKHIVVNVLEKDGVYQVKGFILETGSEVPEVSGSAQHTFPVAPAEISSLICVEDRISCYIILNGKDHTISLINSGRMLWLREESLTSILSLEMISLPVSDMEAAIEKEFNSKEASLLGMLTRRVASQVSQILTALGIGDDSSLLRSTLVRDIFGLHKLIVIVTGVSKVFGIDNENGEIVWQYQVEGVTPFVMHGKPHVPFFVQRTARHHPYPAICTLLFKSNENQSTVLFVFNPINGQPLEGGIINTGIQVLQATLLPQNNHEFIKGLLMLSTDEKVHIFPSSAKNVALEYADSMYLFAAAPSSDKIYGYSFAASSAKELTVTTVWTLELTGELVSITPKNPQEKVHSQGRVLSDRSVLYKYVNPNLVAFATYSNDPVHKGILNVYLVDVVSGDVKFSMTHKRVAKPIHVVHSENWLVYSYYNDKYRRCELITLDLYEGPSQSNSTEFSSLKYQIDPRVERQAYIFPHHVVSMKETITEKGITSKHVLVGVESGGVIEVPWVLLDPRRPLNPTPEAREEGVIPYIPELVLPSEATITYNQTISSISGIYTSPSTLESTCLVFVHGMDLFYTRVTPSKTFDVLKEDFDYWLISVVLIALTTAAFVTKRLSSRKALRHGWK